jgi:hypothetical protein
MSLFPHTCRDITRLVLQRSERRLGPLERAAVRVHLGLCRMCRRFEGQLRLMDRAVAQWKAYAEDVDAN